MPARLLGAHMPTSGGLDKAVRNGHAIGCTAVQVFTSSPQTWKSKSYSASDVQNLETALTETGIGPEIISHDSYLINLAAPDPEQRAKSVQGLIGEMLRCAQLGIGRVVSHMGAHMGAGEAEGLRLVAEGARQILAETPDSVTLLVETTAGQGTCLFWQFEHHAKLLELCHGHPRLGVCLDTCHIFCAGYDIRTPETYEATMSRFSELIGFDRLLAVHCNDSLRPFESRKDRHQHIGKGEIGMDAFRMLVQDDRFADIPLLLETPEADTMHAENLATLKALAAEPA